MSIQFLIGLTLDGCRFSKGSYALDFSGKLHNESRKYQISTSYNLSSTQNEDDVYEQVSTFLWSFLDLRLTEIQENENKSEVIFKFENGGTFTIWAEDDIDNLLIVTDLITDKWFTVL
ncbi:MAG: hypothetical protein ACI9AT_000528 [Ulvibacter sp.]|jgi:hypothetical protein